MRRSVLPIYALILLETLVWIAIVPLAPTFADELSLSGIETGMILGAGSFTALLVAFPVGRLADRLGARRVTIASAFVFTAATLGQGLADTFWPLVLARGVFGLAFGTMWSAGAAWLSDSLPEARRASALAATTTVSGVGFTLGPALAGLLADRFDTGTPFVVVAVAAALVTAALALAGPPAPGRVPPQRLRDMLRSARNDELVLAGLAIIMLIGLVGGGINLLVPLQLEANGVSAGEIGILFSVASAVYTVASALVARLGERTARPRIGGTAALLTGASILLVLASGSTLAAVSFVLLRAPFWATMDTIIFPLGAAGAHRSALGRGSVMGLLAFGWAAAATVGPLLAGGITDAIGERAAYAAMIAVCSLCGLWLLSIDRRRRGVDVDRLYRARDLDELRREYDRIASTYDSELVAGYGWETPGIVAETTHRLVPRDALILDAGAGTGLLGVALADAGFAHLDGLDLSPGMLAEAARKRVYRDLREARLGDRLDWPDATYDAVVAAGVLTTGHAPATSLDELVRITKRGGHVIFTLRSDQVPPGFEDKIHELEDTTRWGLVERSDEYQAMPNGHPEVMLRVWAFRVL